MNFFKIFFFVLLNIFLNYVLTQELDDLKPPIAKKIPKKFEAHGIERIDNYYWMRDDSRSDKEVIKHLKQENKYLESWFRSGVDYRKEIFNEIVSRIPKKEDSVPVPMGSYEYYRRYKPDREYPIYIRRKKNTLKEQVILDVNRLAEGKNFYQLSNWSISPSENKLAFAEDLTGRREYIIRIKRISSDSFLDERLTGTSGDIAWSKDGKFIFYVKRDPETLLPYQVYRHRIGDKQSEDVLIYQEEDNTFHVSVGNTRSMKYVEIYISSTTSSETLLIDSSSPSDLPNTVLKREKNHIYSVEDDGDLMIIRTNWKAKNFRLMSVPKNQSTKKTNWQELLPHNEEILIQSFLSFPTHIVTLERTKGLSNFRLIDKNDNSQKFVNFQDQTYETYFAANPEYENTKFYIGYSSLRTPDTVYSISLKSSRKKLLKQVEVKGPFEPNRYKVERFFIKGRDNTSIPVSLIYRKDSFIRGSNPLFVYGYGSYGISMDTGFSYSRISLIDRGFVFAVAHIRGGQELGRKWYEDGKMMKKKNTFNDFIDVTESLLNKGYGHRERVYAGGGSAGGLLMGAVVNQKPELFKGVISNVPFVDIVTTMSDSSIPLTTGEYSEWGNPEDEREFKYILSYSPYDNIKAYHYPSILVTTGLWDSQVQYYEPAKYVAKIREFNKSNNPILMKANLTAGHSGISGRFASLKEVAMEYAFLLRIDKEKGKSH